MRLCSFRSNNRLLAGVVRGEEVLAVTKINRELGADFATSLDDLLARQQLPALHAALENSKQPPLRGLPLRLAPPCVPYTSAKKIWGVSSNDWTSDQPDARLAAPAGFLKPVSTLIGPGEPVVLPASVGRVSAEIALGIIVGKTATRLPVTEVPQAILGFITVLDLTAIDLVQHAPLQLASAKSFDTSLSLGPWIVTPDEVPDVSQLTAMLRRNDEPPHTCCLGDLPVSPYALLAMQSATMTWHAGDLFFCAMPGKVMVQPGDTITCEIRGLGMLENFVAAVPRPAHQDIP